MYISPPENLRLEDKFRLFLLQFQIHGIKVREDFKNKLAKLIVLPSALKDTEGCRRHRRTMKAMKGNKGNEAY